MTSKAITNSARGEVCSIRLPHICNGNTETTVFAHVNGVRFGHGVGKKVSDLLGAYACADCHNAADGRTSLRYSKEYLQHAHYQCVFETQLKLLEKGLITIK